MSNRTFEEWLRDANIQVESYDDPLALLGHNVSFDNFTDWLDIAKEEDDEGLESYKAVFEKLISFNHFEHASVVLRYINKII